MIQGLALRIVEAVLIRTIQRTRRFIPSRTIRDALRGEIEVTKVGVIGRMVVPHYWAVFYHDGRGAMRAPSGKFLVFFRSAEDDPRRPRVERASQERPLALTPGQFKQLIREGKLIVRKKVRPFRGTRFFRKAERGYLQDLRQVAVPRFRQALLADLRSAGLLRRREVIRLRVF